MKTVEVHLVMHLMKKPSPLRFPRNSAEERTAWRMNRQRGRLVFIYDRFLMITDCLLSCVAQPEDESKLFVIIVIVTHFLLFTADVRGEREKNLNTMERVDATKRRRFVVTQKSQWNLLMLSLHENHLSGETGEEC